MWENDRKNNKSYFGSPNKHKNSRMQVLCGLNLSVFKIKNHCWQGCQKVSTSEDNLWKQAKDGSELHLASYATPNKSRKHCRDDFLSERCRIVDSNLELEHGQRHKPLHYFISVLQSKSSFWVKLRAKGTDRKRLFRDRFFFLIVRLFNTVNTHHFKEEEEKSQITIAKQKR